MSAIKIVGTGITKSLFLNKELLSKDKLMNKIISSQEILANPNYKVVGDNSAEDFNNVMKAASDKFTKAMSEIVRIFDVNKEGCMKDPYTLYKLKDPITSSYSETSNEGTKTVKVVCEHIAIKKSELGLISIKNDQIDLKKNTTEQATFYKIVDDRYNPSKMGFRPVSCLVLSKDIEASAEESSIFLRVAKRYGIEL
jgi:hypothetical protein